MKKFVLLLLLLSAVFANAQETKTITQEYPRNEISVGWGVGSSVEIFGLYTDLITAAFVRTYNDYTYSGPISLEYYHHFSPLFSVGGIFNYEHANADIISDWDNRNENIGKEKSNYYTLMPAVKCDWLHKKSFSLYSKLGAGITYAQSTDKYTNQSNENAKDDNSQWLFNFQLSLIGVQFGKKVCGFVELGLGQQGIVSTGIKYRF